MVEKAKIHILDKGGNKTGDPIKVMFNPTEYTFGATGVVPTPKDGGATKVQFTRVNVDDFSVTLHFYTYEKTGESRDVRKEIEKIASLVVPTVEGKKTKQPPICLFCWGNFTYKGFVYKLVQKFTMFLSTGIPVRAEVTVTFKAHISKEEDAIFTGKEACRKLWTVKAGDRLDLIAYNTLLDVNQWDKIAQLNNIADPMAFPTENDIGRIIVIPDL